MIFELPLRLSVKMQFLWLKCSKQRPLFLNFGQDPRVFFLLLVKGGERRGKAITWIVQWIKSKGSPFFLQGAVGSRYGALCSVNWCYYFLPTTGCYSCRFPGSLQELHHRIMLLSFLRNGIFPSMPTVTWGRLSCLFYFPRAGHCDGPESSSSLTLNI